MRKLMPAVLAVLCLAMSITGCSGGNKNKTVAKKHTTETSKKLDIKKIEEEQQAEYVVELDDSFDSGVELEKARQTLSPEEADFRNLKWGMSKDDVIYAQGTGFREPKENTMYYTRVREEGYPADAEYTFEDGKLTMGIFYITKNKGDKPVTVADYDDLVASLQGRFSAPDIVDAVYTDKNDKTEDYDEQLNLIKKNKLQLRTGWELDDTQLRIVFFANGSTPCIGLRYQAKS